MVDVQYPRRAGDEVALSAQSSQSLQEPNTIERPGGTRDAHDNAGYDVGHEVEL